MKTSRTLLALAACALAAVSIGAQAVGLDVAGIRAALLRRWPALSEAPKPSLSAAS